MEEIVSIVIPAYNAASFIERTVKSVKEQTYPHWELVIVDDGSTDNTKEIIDRLAKEDERITAIHQSNGGEVAARRTGVLNATGTWIMFVDADDVLPAQSIESLIIHGTDMDIVTGTMHVQMIDSSGKTSEDYVWQNKKEGEMTGMEFATGVFLYQVQMSACGKLYQRSLFESFDWCLDRDIKQNPDLLMNIGIGAYAKRIFVTNKAVCYNYIIHEGSASTSSVMPYTSWFKLFDVAKTYLKAYPKQSLFYEAFTRYRLERFDGMMRHGIVDFSSSDVHVKEVLCDSRGLKLSKDESKVVCLLRCKTLRKVFDWWQQRKYKYKNDK